MNTTGSNTSMDLAVELASVRTDVERAHSAGMLDAATYGDAQNELNTAEKALQENTSDTKGTLLRTLRRLYGLVMEATEVAAKVGSLITAVKELS